MLVSTQV